MKTYAVVTNQKSITEALQISTQKYENIYLDTALDELWCHDLLFTKSSSWQFLNILYIRSGYGNTER